MISHAFEDLGAHKIFAETTDSVRAAGLMKKLGMKPEGVQRSHIKDNAGNWADLYLYGLLREDRDAGNESSGSILFLHRKTLSKPFSQL